MNGREEALAAAVRQLMPWVSKGLAEGTYANCVSPEAAERAIALGEKALWMPWGLDPNPSWVRQEHANGCGFAALAMLTGKSYAEVLADFGQTLQDNPEYTYDPMRGSPMWQHMDRYLEEHGFAVSRKFHTRLFGQWLQWPPQPWAQAHLCNVTVHESSTRNHWVVMLANGDVLDPETEKRKRLTDYAKVNSVAALAKI